MTNEKEWNEKEWNPLTQKYEEIDYSPILLTNEQYAQQLNVGVSEWFRNSDTHLVNQSLKWTLERVAHDGSKITLLRRGERLHLSANEFVAQFSFDHWA